MTRDELQFQLDAFRDDFAWDLETPPFERLLCALHACSGAAGEVAKIAALIAEVRASIPAGWKPARRSGAMSIIGTAEQLVSSGGMQAPVRSAGGPGASPVRRPEPAVVPHGTLAQEFPRALRGQREGLRAAALDALARGKCDFYTVALAAALLDDAALYRQAVDGDYLVDDRAYHRQKESGMQEEDLGSTPSPAVSAQRIARIAPAVLKEMTPDPKTADLILKRLQSWAQAL